MFSDLVFVHDVYLGCIRAAGIFSENYNTVHECLYVIKVLVMRKQRCPWSVSIFQ